VDPPPLLEISVLPSAMSFQKALGPSHTLPLIERGYQDPSMTKRDQM